MVVVTRGFVLYVLLISCSLFPMENNNPFLAKKAVSVKKNLSSLNNLNDNLRVKRQQVGANPFSHISAASVPAKVNGSDDVVIDMSQLPNKGKDSDQTVTTSSSQAPVYTQAHVAEMLSATNPILYNFGQKHNIPIEQLLEYANLLQEYHLEPAALVEFVKNHNQLNKTKPTSWEVKQYEHIQKKDPEKYMELVLSVIKKIQDQTDGKQKTSVMNSTHVGVLHDQVVDQQDTLYKGKIAFIVQTLITVGTAVWGIYGQVATHSASCNNGTGV